MEEQEHITIHSTLSPINHDNNAPSSSASPALQLEELEQTEVHNEQDQQQQPLDRPRLWHWQPSLVFQWFHITFISSGSDDARNDAWSCLIVLLTFWFLASMILILGFYGSFNLQLGPNCSFLIKTNPFFVHSIKAQQIDEHTAGPMLYGFHELPSLDVETTWSQNYTVFIEPDYHKEWAYYLNAGSRVDVSYDVKVPDSASLFFVIARGRGSLLEWISSPSYPNTTMSWHIIYGSGNIALDINESDTYFVAVGNLNLETTEVYLNFTIMSLLYNTTDAHFKCLLRDRTCSFKLILLKPSAAVLTSPGPGQVKNDNDWYVQVSFGPQWVTYCGGSCIVAALILVLFRYLYHFQSNTEDEAGNQENESVADRRQPLLSHKNNDHSNWGSSYDSIPSDEDQGLEDKMISEDSLEGEVSIGREIHHSHNTRRLCAICFDAPRDSFFLPCGHCAACFSCGSRIAEEAGTCPICRRKMKKVKKIFSV